MSLRRILNDLQTKELEQLEVLDAARTLLADFHKGIDDGSKVLEVLCELYPLVLKRSIQGKTLLHSFRVCIEKNSARAGVVPLTRTVVRNRELYVFEPEQRQWLIGLVSNDQLRIQALDALEIVDIPPFTLAKLARSVPLGSTQMMSATPCSVVTTDALEEAERLDNNPRLDADILARLPEIMNYLLPESPKQPLTTEWKRCFERILEDPVYVEENESRMRALEALLALFRVYSPCFSLNHETIIGAWVIGCICSRSRQIRLKAVQTISHFVTDATSPSELAMIFNNILKLQIRDPDQPADAHYETVVAAWKAGAISCQSEHLNFFLVKLVKELSPTNPIKNALALESIYSVARAKDETPYQLFMPFWKTIAVYLVQREGKDQVLDQFCMLCGITRDVFLARTARTTLPSLVLFEKSHTIQMIAKAQATSLDRLVRDNIGPIIALLLASSSAPEDFAERKLRAIGLTSFGFGIRTIVSNKKHTRDILAELLKLSQTCDHNRIIAAIQYVFPGNLDLDVVFNLISHYTQDLCFNRNGKLFPTGKAPYLEGLVVLLESGTADVFNTRSQVFTLLQSQMNDPLTAYYSLKCWLAMLKHLDSKRACQSREFYDLSIAILAYKWNDLEAQAKDQGRRILEHIACDEEFEDHLRLYGFVRSSEPHFQSKVDTMLKRLGTKLTPLARFRQIVDRCSQENFYIVCQSVYDLWTLISEHQEIVGIQLRAEDSSYGLQEAIRVVISVAKRFEAPELRAYCANCLGVLGALDPYRVDLETRTEERPVVIDSFGVVEESNKFVAYVIEHYLLPELQATSDPDLQMYLGYVIQEFLKFCGFGPEKRYEMEQVFRNDGSLLSPFLFTKYKLKFGVVPPQRRGPVYKPKMAYSHWLRVFTFDIMCKATGGNAQTIFSLLSFLFSKDREVFHLENIARFALPYAVLNTVLLSSRAVDMISEEFTYVLNQSGTDAQISLIHQCIFSIFDYFAVWMREKRKTGKTKELTLVETLYNNISPVTLGERAIECQNYPRAIRYWEQAIRNGEVENTRSVSGSPAASSTSGSILSRFSQLYANLEDVDSMEGVSTQFKSWTLDQRILHYKKTEQWDAALASYGLLAQDLDKWDSGVLEGTLECYRSSGRPELVLSRLASVDPALVTPKMVDIGVESSWMCENWKQFEDLCKIASPSSLATPIAQCIRAIKHREPEELHAAVERGALLAMDSIARQEVNSLSQIRSELIFLHAICDISAISTAKGSTQDTSDGLSQALYTRLNRIGSNFEDRDYLLSLRRVVYKLMDGAGCINSTSFAGTYYNSAREARKSGRYVKAIEYVLKALELKHPLARREHAKLQWKQGNQEQALRTLAQELNGFDTDYAKFKSVTNSPILAKNALLYTEWLDSSGYATTEELVGRYNVISRMVTRWDKVFQRHAKHWLKIFEYQLQMEPTSREISYYDGTLFTNIIVNLFRTLKYGSKYVEESMPKFLTLWLDFSSQEHADIARDELTGRVKDYELRNIMDKRLRAINDFNRVFSSHLKERSRIPVYFFYNALPQLLSRITTINPEVYQILKTIITLVCRYYPHQATWSLIEATKSDNTTRRKRGNEILNSAIHTHPDIFSGALRVVDEFVRLCAYDIRQDKSLTQCTLSNLKFNAKVVSQHGRNLTVPIQKFMESVMPSPGADFRAHNAFPISACFYAIDDQVDIMSSLQRPKKVTVRADDGCSYGILCKGHDDVRKDARLLDFSTSINQLLSRDQKAVARHLQILSYKVVPLMEKGGLIEWIDGAIPTRKLIKDAHETRGIMWNFQKFQKLLDLNGDPSRRVRNFEIICKEVGPVLYEIFLQMFPDPAAWLKARNLYTQSTAVMSIVGYILGLGDRHLENLLIVQHSCACLHVDFDCLFDKGATFAIPEVVPFRLTQNMIDAFGVHGYEGPFRKSCEITLELLHKNEGLLMTILEPFVHDPVIASEHQRRSQYTPKKAMQKIQKKLKLYKMPSDISPSLVVGAPLSVQGLVEDLIKTATDPVRLSSMYIGWCSFL